MSVLQSAAVSGPLEEVPPRKAGAGGMWWGDERGIARLWLTTYVPILRGEAIKGIKGIGLILAPHRAKLHPVTPNPTASPSIPTP